MSTSPKALAKIGSTYIFDSSSARESMTEESIKKTLIKILVENVAEEKLQDVKNYIRMTPKDTKKAWIKMNDSRTARLESATKIFAEKLRKDKDYQNARSCFKRLQRTMAESQRLPLDACEIFLINYTATRTATRLKHQHQTISFKTINNVINDTLDSYLQFPSTLNDAFEDQEQ